MRRVLLLVALVAATVTLAVWFADHPGVVSLEWAGFRFDTSIGVLFALVVFVAAAAAASYRLWRFLRRAPRNLSNARQVRRRRQGYRFLSQGMVAVAAGDSAEAARLSKKADRLLQEPALTMLLSAQAAQLDGDEDAAQRYFSAMLDQPDMAFLGVRGLLTQAIKSGDATEALQLAKQANGLRPNTKWVVEELFDQQIAISDWAAADDTISRSSGRRKPIDPVVARRRRAVLGVAESQNQETQGNAAAALQCAQRAFDLDPTLVPAATALGRLLGLASKTRKALRVIESAWRGAPHPELAAIYNSLDPKASDLDRVKRAQRLADLQPDHAESHIALARAALAANLWGEARHHLSAVIDNAESDTKIDARVYRLMANIETAEHNDAAAAGRWLAIPSQADSAWICDECGGAHDEWRPVCGHCGQFDGLQWRAPRNIPQHQVNDESNQIETIDEKERLPAPMTR
ncbi:MAG: HemY protein [Alphaproteobacteria bacterium]|jgi:HemY protein